MKHTILYYVIGMFGIGFLFFVMGKTIVYACPPTADDCLCSGGAMTCNPNPYASCACAPAPPPPPPTAVPPPGSTPAPTSAPNATPAPIPGYAGATTSCYDDYFIKGHVWAEGTPSDGYALYIQGPPYYSTDNKGYTITVVPTPAIQPPDTIAASHVQVSGITVAGGTEYNDGSVTVGQDGSYALHVGDGYNTPSITSVILTITLPSGYNTVVVPNGTPPLTPTPYYINGRGQGSVLQNASFITTSTGQITYAWSGFFRYSQFGGACANGAVYSRWGVVDFGIANVPSYTISGSYFDDLNRNGVLDNGEYNDTGYTFTATTSGGLATNTNASNYSSVNLNAGTYTVSLKSSTPPDYTLVTPSSYTITLPCSASTSIYTCNTTTGNITGLNFGVAPTLYSISGNIYDLSVGTGQPPSTTTLSNLRLYIVPQAWGSHPAGTVPAISSLIPNTDGTFTFSGLTKGGYLISFTGNPNLPSGYIYENSSQAVVAVGSGCSANGITGVTCN